MQLDSHKIQKTRISIIRDHVSQWRKAAGLSREAAALVIVESHIASGGPAATGIHFDTNSGDSYTTAKTHADRIFRWLDDETKDSNFMPANFENSILLALPLKYRMACLDDLLRPLGLACRSTESNSEGQINASALFCDVVKEDSDTHQAMAAAMACPDQANLLKAERELSESIEVQTKARAAFEAARAKVELKNSPVKH